MRKTIKRLVTGNAKPVARNVARHSIPASTKL